VQPIEEPVEEPVVPLAPAAGAPVGDQSEVPDTPFVVGMPVPLAPDASPDAPQRRRRRVFDRRAASTTRRRRERTETTAAEGFLQDDTIEDVVVAPVAPVTPVVPDSPSVGSPVSPGIGGTGATPPTPPPPPLPPSPPLPPPSAPTFGTGGAGEPSPQPAASVLDSLAATLAPGEQVRHVVVGRTSGIDCALARTDRRVLVVAARAGRPLVQSLHPTRTVVRVLGPRSVPASVVVIDGTQRLEIVGVDDRAEAERLAAG